jgi:hypothetical protein
LDRLRIRAINAAERALLEQEHVIIKTQTRIDELVGLTFRPVRSQN